MNNKKFYVILNIINIFLLLYTIAEFYIFFYLIFSSSTTGDLYAFGSYIFYILSKFIFLPIFVYVFGILFNLSIVKDFAEELKNKPKRNIVLKYAFMYDILAIIFLIWSNPIGIISFFFTYELFTIGGIVLFYMIWFARLDENNLKEKGWL